MNGRRCGVAAAICSALLACAGNEDARSDAAGGDPTYGAPVAASAEQANVLQGVVSSALALQGAPDGSSALGAADLGSVTTALLGEPGADWLGALMSVFSPL